MEQLEASFEFTERTGGYAGIARIMVFHEEVATENSNKARLLSFERDALRNIHHEESSESLHRRVDLKLLDCRVLSDIRNRP